MIIFWHRIHILHILHIPLSFVFFFACQNIMEQHLQVWCCSSLYIENHFHLLQKSLQYCPDECKNDPQIDGMHTVAHQMWHLVHTEVGNQPKLIENQVSTNSLPGAFIVLRILAWEMKGSLARHLVRFLVHIQNMQFKILYAIYVYFDIICKIYNICTCWSPRFPPKKEWTWCLMPLPSVIMWGVFVFSSHFPRTALQHSWYNLIVLAESDS